MFHIALDGPSGAGKSTVAKELAKRLNIIYVDTGALYRTIGYYAFSHSISKDDNAAVIASLEKIKIEMVYENGVQKVYLNGEDLGDRIRLPEISMYASAVSAIPEVRRFLLGTQRDIAKVNSVIMDGRDIGTVILPNAEVKIFLTASLETRAKRRYEELIAKGKSVTYEDVYDDMFVRDNNDSSRAEAPAIPADDAIILDNSELDFEQSIQAILAIVNEKISL